MDVKWIKITTDMFDNRKIRHLRRLPDGNNIVLIWVMLLTMAGRCNAGGMIFLTENIPYTPKMLADELDFEESTITLAINALEKFGMVSTDPLMITNWEEYQNVESMEKIREQTRKRMADYRTRKRLGVTSVGENCVYCGKPASTVDHIIPKSKGGKDVAWNLVPCCKLCNSSKSNKDLVDFLNDSFFYAYQGLNHELIQSNEKLMAFVRFDKKQGRYVTVTSSDAPDIDIEEEIEEDIDTVTIPSTREVTGTKKKKDSSKPSFAKDSKPYLLAVFLGKRIKKRLPSTEFPDETKLQAWADAFDKCNRLDGHPWDEIKMVLKFSQDDQFWQANILSGKKFRAKYIELLAKMSMPQTGPQKTAEQSTSTVDRLLRMAQEGAFDDDPK